MQKAESRLAATIANRAVFPSRAIQAPQETFAAASLWPERWRIRFPLVEGTGRKRCQPHSPPATAVQNLAVLRKVPVQSARWMSTIITAFAG